MIFKGTTETMLTVARKCRPLMAVLSCLLVINVMLFAAIGNAASGQADKIFDHVFLQSIKDVLSYEQVVKIVGVQGTKVGSDTLKIPGDKYHWKGRKNSSFNLRVSTGKVIDANVITPDGRIISLDKSLEGRGEVHELGK